MGASKEKGGNGPNEDSLKGMTVDGEKYVDDILLITYDEFLGRTQTTSAGHMATLSKGASVIIRSTDNVVQRFPDRAGMVGKITDLDSKLGCLDIKLKYVDGTFFGGIL